MSHVTYPDRRRRCRLRLSRPSPLTAERLVTAVRRSYAHIMDRDHTDHTVPQLLWREALGRALRLRRTDLGLTLAQVSRWSGISTQYLSEVERGLKDPSSEVIEAIAVVLELALPRVLVLAAVEMQQGSVQLAGLGALTGAMTRAAPITPSRGQARLALVA